MKPEPRPVYFIENLIRWIDYDNPAGAAEVKAALCGAFAAAEGDIAEEDPAGIVSLDLTDPTIRERLGVALAYVDDLAREAGRWLLLTPLPPGEAETIGWRKPAEESLGG